MSQYNASPLAQTPLVDEERLATTRKAFRSGPFRRYLTRPLLMATLVLALITSLIYLIQAISLDPRWSWLLLLYFFVALEAIYTTIWLKHPDRLVLDRTAYRAAEFFLILLITGIATWILFAEGPPAFGDLMAYFQSPFELFLNGFFLVSLFLSLLTWRLAIILSSIFSYLEISDFELRYYSLPAHVRKGRSDDQPIQIGRRTLVTEFKRYWLWGGVLLAFAVGLSTIELQSIRDYFSPAGISHLGLPPILLSMLVLYFGIGFWLLSEARFMEQNARWMTNDIHKDSQLETSWQRASLIILTITSIFAAFLPIGSTLAISRIINVLIYWFLLIINLLILMLFLPLVALISLFTRNVGEETPEFQPPVPPNLSNLPEEAYSPISETISLVLSSAFWTVFLVLVVLALLFFIRERKITLAAGTASNIQARIKTWLRNLWHQLIFRIQSIEISMPKIRIQSTKAQPEKSEKTRRWRFIRISSLSPREQIRYFYLSTVRRAGDQGIKRQPSETPLEFADDLRRNWPEAEEGVQNLTTAFLKARYSDQSFSEEDLPPVKETWKAVRKELRRQSSPEQTADESGEVEESGKA